MTGDTGRRPEIEIFRAPKLREPVLVGALAGWVDAGYVGAGAVALLSERLADGAHVASLALDDSVDLAATRPTTKLTDGVVRSVQWPGIDFYATSAGTDYVLMIGREPSLRWQGVAETIVGYARRLGVRRVYLLAGMPAARSHRRPIEVTATATRRSLAQELEPLREDYVGPTGFATALQFAFGEADIDAVGLWAQVPGYLSDSPSPPAVAATLRRLGELSGIEVRLRSLDDHIDDYHERVEESLGDQPELAEAIRSMEEGREESIPSGDELASEIERYLRDQ